MMTTFLSQNRLLACSFLVGLMAANSAMADTLAPPVNLPIGQTIEAPVRSFAALRFDGIVRQTHDLSCGAAALATLLHGYFGLNVSEKGVIDTILASASEEDKAKIGEGGFSMLELKRHAEAQGLVMGGFRARGAEELRNLRAPAIVLVTNRGYSHFVVVRRVVGNDVYIADPAFGNRVDPISRFTQSWNKVFLVAVDPRQAQLPEARRISMQTFRNASPQGRDARGLQASLNRPNSIPLEHVTGEY
jgi:uncharacterized protein